MPVRATAIKSSQLILGYFLGRFGEIRGGRGFAVSMGSSATTRPE